MFRRLSAGLLGAAALAVATFSVAAQEKKDAPKKKERIAVNDPEKAKADPDFLTQGEYVGKEPDGETLGVQVVAKGEGKFVVKVHRGGLPGDGWNGKEVLAGTAETKNGVVTATVKDDQGRDVTGTIAGGAISVPAGGETLTFKKVERKSKTLGEKPPEGSVVLFGGAGDEAKWNGGKLAELPDGKFLGVGVTSKQEFKNFKLHLEFRTPWMPNSTGQQRGNSGLYFQNRYECQVLDSFGLNGENNECGGIYQQYKPAVNMCFPPLAWQTYDVEFTAAEFDSEGKKTKPARATVLHNGVKIHDNVEFKGPTGGGKPEAATPGPFQLQNHGDPVVYRNIWVAETK